MWIAGERKSMYETKVCWALLTIMGSFFVCNGQSTLNSQNCSIMVLDNCGEQITSIVANITNDRLPRTKGEIRDQCEIYRRGSECIVSYSNACLDPFRRQVMLTAIDALRKITEEMCSEEAVEEFLNDHLTCFEATFDDTQRCLRTGLLRLEGISESIKKEDQLQACCCAFFELEDCGTSAIKEKCKKSTIQFIRKFFGGSSNDLLDLACSERDHRSEECRKLLETLPDSEGPKYKSPLPSLIKIMQNVNLQ